jgi:GAF domain-containing protein
MRLAFGTKGKGESKKGLRVLLESIVNWFAAATGKERDEAFSGEQFKLTMDEGKKIFTQKAMESKNPLIINDVDDYVMSEADRDMVERLEIRSMAVFPMFAGDRFVGSISFDHVGHTHKFTQQDINGMYALADLAALMINYAERLVGP